MPHAIQTYHCICKTLVLTTTHTLALLPHRTASLDHALILPFSPSTTLLNLTPDHKPTIIRKDDGFEPRLLHRCAHCALVVGYEIQTGEVVREEGAYAGRILYVLPGGLQSTESMVKAGEIRENDIDITASTPALILEPGRHAA